ncbi:MAG: hypothetical protein ACFB0C_19910 [Leptolyngbyaceae cyanobacterium]
MRYPISLQVDDIQKSTEAASEGVYSQTEIEDLWERVKPPNFIPS